ncbi:MAG: Rieske 2Fe-2S domain-containing protein [Burkholderiaceae bacterium]
MARLDVTEPAGALGEEEAVQVKHNNLLIALCRTTEGFFAVDDTCPHATASLAEGYVIDNLIECPLHQAQFDLATGEYVAGPQCANLKSYPVIEDNELVFLELPDGH